MAVPKALQRDLNELRNKAKQEMFGSEEELEEEELEEEEEEDDSNSRLAEFFRDEEDSSDADAAKAKPKLRVVKDEDDNEDDNEYDDDDDVVVENRRSFLDFLSNDGGIKSDTTNNDEGSQIQSLLKEVKELKAQLSSEASVGKKKKSISDVDVELTTDERQKYAASIPIIKKVATAIASQIVQQELESVLANSLDPIKTEFKSRIDELSTGVSQRSKTTFLNLVRKEIPDVDRLVNLKSFVNKANAIEPNTGMSYGQLLNRAFNDENLESVVHIISVISPKRTKKVPRKTGNKAVKTSPSSRKKYDYKMSDFIKMTRDLSRGRITAEQHQRFKKKFTEARNSGRVLDDVGTH